jgi:eukaryotic-like serine/threonine-protein kinase
MPQTIGRYRIEARLGQGRLGAAYRAFDPEHQRQVALRVILWPSGDDAGRSESFTALQRAARAAATLDHPNIAAVYDHGEADIAAEADSTRGQRRVLYIASAWVDGGSLAGRLRAGTAIEPESACRWMTQVLLALDHAHARGVVHADLKPANVLFAAPDEICLTDFGLNCGSAAGASLGGSIFDAPAYLAPEQLLGAAVDARSDLFAAGVMLYQMLAGRQPFQGQSAAVMKQILAQDPPPASQLQPALGTAFDVVVARALARDPKRRFGSAEQFLLAMNRAIAQRASDADATVILPATATRPVGAPSAAAAADWKGAAAAPLETALADAVGPIARFLVRNALASATSLDAACADLAAQIPAPAARRQFSAAAGKLQAARGAAEDIHADASRAARHSTATPHAQMPNSVIDRPTLDLATERLGDAVGPMARILVDRAASLAESRPDFFRQLAEWIPAPRQRRAFLREFGIGE